MSSELFYKEIQKNILAVPEEDRHELDDRLMNALIQMYDLSCAARKEGLIALEKASCTISETGMKRHLKKMISVIIDGIEPSLAEEIFFLRYYSCCFTSEEALEYLLYMNGAMSIQAGENPWVMEEKLMQLLSERGRDNYRKNIRECREDCWGVRDPSKEQVEKVIEPLLEGEIIIPPDTEGYYEACLLDYIVRHADGKIIQRILRDVDNRDVVYAMQGLGGEARRCIFSNLSNRLAIMIAEDITADRERYLGPIMGSVKKMLHVCLVLQRNGEVVLCPGDKIVDGLLKLLIDRPNDYREAWEQGRVHELEKLFDEYKGGLRLKRGYFRFSSS